MNSLLASINALEMSQLTLQKIECCEWARCVVAKLLIWSCYFSFSVVHHLYES